MMDVDQARFNMVEQQIRTWHVLDKNILNLLFEVKRELFVPLAHQALAFADLEIPLGYGQTMLEPKIEARILQSLAIRATDHVLEIGTGSGYMAALLAARAHHVYTVEIIPELSALARENLRKNKVNNVTVEDGDASQGWLAHKPYDVIVISASTPVLPQGFLDQLKVGGRLFAFVGEPPAMQAQLIRHVSKKRYSTENIFETDIAPLLNAQRSEHFVF